MSRSDASSAIQRPLRSPLLSENDIEATQSPSEHLRPGRTKSGCMSRRRPMACGSRFSRGALSGGRQGRIAEAAVRQATHGLRRLAVMGRPATFTLDAITMVSPLGIGVSSSSRKVGGNHWLRPPGDRRCPVPSIRAGSRLAGWHRLARGA